MNRAATGLFFQKNVWHPQRRRIQKNPLLAVVGFVIAVVGFAMLPRMSNERRVAKGMKEDDSSPHFWKFEKYLLTIRLPQRAIRLRSKELKRQKDPNQFPRMNHSKNKPA